MIEIFKDVDMTGRNTFGMKVRAACVVEYDGVEELERVRDVLEGRNRDVPEERIGSVLEGRGTGAAGSSGGGAGSEGDAETGLRLPVPVLHIGGGSNLLFTKDFPGTVLHSRIRFIRVLDPNGNGSEEQAGGAGGSFEAAGVVLPSGEGEVGVGRAVDSGAEFPSREGEIGAGRYGQCGEGDHSGENGCWAEADGAVRVEVGAGVVWDEFCLWCAEKGLWGVENLSGIPGEVGAAAVQNIGAYGVEVKDVIERVVCFDMVLGRETVFRAADCGYVYRDSLFKRDRKGRYVVTSVVFSLSQSEWARLEYGHLKSAVAEAVGETGSGRVAWVGSREMSGTAEVGTETDGGTVTGAALTPGLVRQTVLKIRDGKLPDPAVVGSAGSYFKNPVVPKSDYDRVVSVAGLYLGAGCRVPHYDMGSGFVKIPAAWLIEQCGWKGYVDGNVGVYEKQPLVIVNVTGMATPGEVLELERRIVSSVRERFGIVLDPEVEHI